jgi:N,N'-diacetyllegionaminate synthase
MKGKVFIIAEAGVNHNGQLDLALQMIETAAEAGADAVKFQTFKAERLVTKSAPKAQYQMQFTDINESQIVMLRKLELNEESHKVLSDRAKHKGIQFMSSAFDLEGIELLFAIGVEIFKIPSGEITNLPYLRKIGSIGKKVIMSTGMADLDEIEDALSVITNAGTPLENITVLHCTTAYPASMDQVNLRAMNTIARVLGVSVGYSDHTLGVEIPIAAAALGARVVEKHFTLDRSLPGPDHQASLEPTEFQEMVKAIRNVEKALGDGIKKPSSSELENKLVVRKSIVASRKICKGEVFSVENITVKRPGSGFSPMLWDSFIGKTAKRDFDKDELVDC